MGCVKFVERLKISLPWTTILSFDFLRSRVSISDVTHVISHCSRSGHQNLTVAAGVKVKSIAYADIDNAQEPLVLFLELLLVEYLYSEYAVLRNPPVSRSVSQILCEWKAHAYTSKDSFQ